MKPDEMAERIRADQRKLYMLARGMTLSEHDALDIASETAYRALKSAARVRVPEAAGAYLAKIALNLCRSHLRRRGRETLLPAPDLLSTPDETDQVDLREMIEHLPIEYREIVLLRFYMNLSKTEIAAALSMPESTVRFRLKRALSMLRGILEEDDVHEDA